MSLFNTRQANECPSGSLMGIPTKLTFEDKLQQEKKQLEERLDSVNAVLKSLKEAPGVSKVLEALNKLGY